MRNLTAPALAEFCERYPAVELSLQLADRPVDLDGDEIDPDIRVGHVDEPRRFAQCPGRQAFPVAE